MRAAFRIAVSVTALTSAAVAALAQTNPPPVQPPAKLEPKAKPATTDATKRAIEAAPKIDTYKQCVNDWDKGTHIDKVRWAQICKERTKAATTR